MACLAPDLIDRLASGTAGAAERAAAERHLTACERCRARLAEAQSRIQMAQGVARAREDADMTAAALPPQPLPSCSIAGYELVREVSRGGQGAVYQAIQKSTKRKVALKLLLEGDFASASARRRFEREIDMIAQLKHPHIITIFDSGVTSDGRLFFAMDYVRGVPLRHYVRENKLTLERMLSLFVQVCHAVQYAHQRGVIHRDLKPSNILIDSEGMARIFDFGLAKQAAAPVDTVMSITGQLVGTLPYMSPEQARGNPDQIDTRTDVYALGVILYELLTGHYPYTVVGQLEEVLRNIRETPPTPPGRAWQPDSGIAGRPRQRSRHAGACPIDDEIQTIALKCLAKERERRYQSAGELAADVSHYLAGEPIEAKRDSAWYVLRKQIRRYRVPVTAGAVLALFLAIFTIVMWAQAVRYQALAIREASAKSEAWDARDAASKQRDRAEAAERAAVAETARAEQVAAHSLRAAYDLRIALAQRAHREGNSARLMQLLNACPAELRAWDWFHLRANCPKYAIPTQHQGLIRDMGFSPDGAYLFSCGEDGTARFFETATGILLKTIQVSLGSVLCGALRTDATQLVTGSADGHVDIWYVPSGTPRLHLTHGTLPVMSVAFSPSEPRVAAADSSGSIKVWEMTPERLLRTIAGSAAASSQLAFSADGERLVCITSEGILTGWNIESGEVLVRHRVSDSAHGICVALGASGTPVFSADWHSVRRREPFAPREPTSFSIAEPVRHIAPHPRADRVAVTDGSGRLSLWDFDTGMETLTLSSDQPITAATFSADGRWLAGATTAGQLTLWDGSPELRAILDTGVPAATSEAADTRWRRSIERGLAWLATHQAKDGSYGGHSAYGGNTGITALAGLAFVADGNDYKNGRFARVVNGCLSYILSSKKKNGLLSGESYGPMYNHSFAVVFLAALYKRAPRDDIKSALRDAVQLIERAQSGEGGWRYHPEPRDADTSVTSCQVVALRAAANVGFACSAPTFESARRYLLSCQNPDGGFRYMTDSSGSALPRSAAALAALLYLGEGGEPVNKALDYISAPTTDGPLTGHVVYFHYYATQAKWLAGGDQWATWWPRVRDTLVARQDESGSWQGQAGVEYGTAMTLIILQFPTGTLPMLAATR